MPISFSNDKKKEQKEYELVSKCIKTIRNYIKFFESNFSLPLCFACQSKIKIYILEIQILHSIFQMNKLIKKTDIMKKMNYLCLRWTVTIKQTFKNWPRIFGGIVEILFQMALFSTNFLFQTFRQMAESVLMSRRLCS